MQDGIRLRHFLPAVLRQFDERMSELIIVVDAAQEEGRIKMLHTSSYEYIPIEQIKEEITDPRVKFIPLDYEQLDKVSKKWFSMKGINRCQSGTPVFGFVYAIEMAVNDVVLRTDCDMIIQNRGIDDALLHFAKDYDLIQLPWLKDGAFPLTSRAFGINKTRVMTKLPLRLARLDLLRLLHRRFMGRPAYLALEDTLRLNIQTGKLSSIQLDTTQGRTMHISTRREFRDIGKVIDQFQHGYIPQLQLLEEHDFQGKFWK